MQQNRRSVFSLIRRGALCALALVMLCAAALAQDYPYETIVNANVNMRRSASSSSTVLNRLKQGEEITVLGVSGNYYRVSYAGRTGYIMKQYVVDETAVLNPETASGYPYYTTTKDSVNLRQQASVNSARLTEIPKGAQITVHGVAGSFATVTYGNQTGYAMTAYLNMKTVTATPTPPVSVVTSAPGQLQDATFANIRKGDTGSAVRALQEALIELGYLSGTADGKFGSGTESALLAFQQTNQYPLTGVADANLQAFLYNGTPKNASGKKTEIKTLAPIYGVTVRLNDRGELVENIQSKLQQLGYYTGSISGVYDADTRTAIRDFQKKHGLKVDGICGTATQEKLFSVGALRADQTATPTPTATPKPTPTPTAVPVYETPGMTVRRGDSGNDAKLVQNRLKQLGYYTGKVDGKFWDESVDALKAFQKAHGLATDGVAGKGTYAVLFHYSALAAGTTATPKPTSVPTPTPTPTATPLTQQNTVTIRLGATGEAVRSLQKRLAELGYYKANADGVYKADDVAAVKAFQQQHGLTVDGVAGYDTQSRLYSSNAQRYQAATGSGSNNNSSSTAYTTLRKGMTGTAVQEMQQRLINLGFLADKADGKYGTNTAEAVYNFQKANGLMRDGIAGAQTLAKLFSSSAAQATPKPTATPKPNSNSSSAGVGTTVRQGDSNEAVKTLQQRLISLGYLSGKADGIFGLKTYQALVNFQRANRLTADGIAGAKTWNVITGSSAVANGSSKPAATPTVNPNASQSYLPRASAVQYKNWYDVIRAHARKYPYATVYDYNTGISWQVHMFSLGKHADSEPVTAADTAKMMQAFNGKNTWNPKPVWVIFADGTIYMASTHSMPHDPQHNYDNNFDGHLCIHFPRTASEVAAIGPYATSHQKKIDEGWKQTQAMIR